jgi:hypothetical protein
MKKAKKRIRFIFIVTQIWGFLLLLFGFVSHNGQAPLFASLGGVIMIGALIGFVTALYVNPSYEVIKSLSFGTGGTIGGAIGSYLGYKHGGVLGLTILLPVLGFLFSFLFLSITVFIIKGLRVEKSIYSAAFMGGAIGQLIGIILFALAKGSLELITVDSTIVRIGGLIGLGVGVFEGAMGGIWGTKLRRIRGKK